MRINKIFIQVIIVVIILLIFLISVEVILRVIYPEKTKLAYKFDRDYLVSLKPNMAKTYVRKKEEGGGIISWKINSKGFRGPELIDNPNYRIMVYGDSNIQARFSKLEDTFVYKLQYYLKKTGLNNIEVINAGIVGFGPDQSLIKLSKELMIYNPNLIIFNVFADNDFGDIFRNRLFQFGKDDNIIETGHIRKIDKLIKNNKELLIIRLIKKLIRRLKDGELNQQKDVIAILQEYAKDDYKRYGVGESRYRSHFMDYYDIDIALYPNSESAQTKIKLMGAILTKTKIIAGLNKAQFMVLIEPSTRDLTRHRSPNYEDFQEYPDYRRESLTNALESICVSSNIYYLNLFKIFSNNNSQDLYFSTNDHWNNKGQEIAAKATASYIINKLFDSETASLPEDNQ